MTARGTLLLALLLLPAASLSAAEPNAPATAPAGPSIDVSKALPDFSNPQAASGALGWVALITILAVAPAVVILTTCFTRVVVVLGLLRQGFSTPQIPPNQVLLGLSLVITFVVMSPVLGQIHEQAWAPYAAGKLPAAEAAGAGEKTIRAFMIQQVERAGNGRDMYLFLRKDLREKADLAWLDVPTPSLIAGYVVSELKVAFLIGVRIFLPFVIVDMLVATVLASMGMLMLPPVLVSLPLKLLLFVLADGWNLVIGTLMKGLQ